MFRSQLFDHLQGVVLRASAITTFSACLRRLFDMWLYVVYVCACLMYLSVGCLVVNSKRFNQLSGIYNNQFSGHAGTFPEGKIKRGVKTIIPINCRSEE